MGRRNKKGFTLIEILIVITIIASLYLITTKKMLKVKNKVIYIKEAMEAEENIEILEKLSK